MIGLLVDIAAVAVIAGFAWAGASLGMVRSVTRLAGALGAAGVAVLVRDPLARLFHAVLSTSTDASNLLALLLVGAGGYAALAVLLAYSSGWVPHERLLDLDRTLGAIPGGLLGLAWMSLMVLLLVLTPADNPIARAAIRSTSGHLLVAHAGSEMRWVNRQFPHYTQTLPKGDDGAVVRTRSAALPLVDPSSGDRLDDDAGRLLTNLNQLRCENDAPDLVWNPSVANASARYAGTMSSEAFLRYRTPEGQTLRLAVKQSLGSNVALYGSFGEQVGWAHSEPNLFATLVKDSRARKLLVDPRFTEVGIGAVDGGWFNGRFYAIGLIGRGHDDGADRTVDSDPTSTGAPTAPATAAKDACDSASSSDDPTTA